ncbi:molecular chaperone DnaJ [Altererythrobacter endophyticus]|uniref:Molecular chaperone DnaJ n=2 Tax=Altericroceibacterium endophyticum TaxID=1808508 RepID=A0A6I4T6M2_9SPHN|nr:molecular chaperone DnaJ [Altericroceibacterium endophyticum]MXO65761.1 molecular chaperone DnaJ [Altericroceibacterium endophyticum]
MLTGRWPWEGLLRPTREDLEKQARRLLGLGPDASREDIIDAHRKRLTAVHPDRGGRHEDVIAVNAARDLLLERMDRNK